MLTLAIELQHNSYAACSWNTAHIEGSVEWPPSSWRILRAIVSGAFVAKRQDSNFDWNLFQSIIKELAKKAPKYYLPPSSYVQINTYRKDRSDNLSLYKSGKMLTSGELRFDSDESTIYIFWDLELDEIKIELLKTCIASCRYLGRSESIAEWEVVSGVEIEPNCYPDSKGLIGVLTPAEDLEFEDLLKSPRQIFDNEARQHIPGATYISYRYDRQVSRDERQQDFKYDFARVELVSNFPLKKERTLYFANKLHKALVSTKEKLALLNFTGIDPSLVSRKDNYSRKNDHVYFVPIVEKGLIIALEMYCEAGFSDLEKNKLAQLRKLYSNSGEIEVRLSLLGNKSHYHQAHCIWESQTPFFLSRIPATRRGKPRMIEGSVFQKDGPQHQALKLLLHLPQFEYLKEHEVKYVPAVNGLEQWVNGSLFCTAQATLFKNWWDWDSNRINGKGKKVTREAYCLKLQFREVQEYPIAIGYSAHFGLGVLAPLRGSLGVEKVKIDKILTAQY